MSTIPYIVIDIETAPAEQKHIDALMADWNPPGNIKDPEKIEARRLEAEQKAKGKASLLDAAPIIVIGFTHRQSFEPSFFDSFGPGNTELNMLESFSNHLSPNTGAGTELVGHNIQAFDLPKLRLAYLRNGLELPSILRVNPGRFQPCFDTMRMFRYWSTENYDNRYVSLETVCRTLGVPHNDGGISGKDVAGCYEHGEYQKILKHAEADVITTLAVYRAMMGVGYAIL